MPERRKPTPEGKDAFLSLVAHEFRNPLTPALGYLRMLLKGTGGSLTDAQERLVTEAHKSIGRLHDLTNQLSELSLIEGGGAAFASEPVDLAVLLAAETASVPESRERGIQVTFRDHAAAAQLHGDGARLRGALGAVIYAVLRELASVDELVVSLRSQQRNGRRAVRLTVAGSDTLDMLESADSSTLAPYDEYIGGVGFRLLIARRILERHGAELFAPREPRHPADPYSKPPPGAVVLLPVA